MGASVELTPNEILDMELWQFNNYIKGYEQRMINKQKQEISLAWHTAVFNNQKKIKPLKTYLEKIQPNKKNVMSKESQLEAIKKAKELDRREVIE